MKRRGLSVYSDHAKESRSSKKGHFRINSQPTKKHHIPASQIFSTTLKNPNPRALKQKPINISTIINDIQKKQKQRDLSRHKNTGKTKLTAVTSLNWGRRRPKENIAQCPFSDILEEAKFRNIDRSVTDVRVVRSHLTSFTKQPARENKVIKSTALTDSLQKTLWKFNSKLKILSLPENASFDSLITVSSCKSLSPNELLVRSPHEPTLFILHVPSNGKHFVPHTNVINHKLALNSKSAIKLSDGLMWYTQWKFLT